jgi:nucleoside-diphosphate-sugar epimerase
MRVLLAGATGAIGRPLIRGLKQHGHSVFGLVRSAESSRMLTEMGAELSSGMRSMRLRSGPRLRAFALMPSSMS